MGEDYNYRALFYYRTHKEQIEKLIAKAKFAYRPALEEIDRPELWTAGHWRWFLKEQEQQ